MNTLNTHILDKSLIPAILDLGWMVKNETWTDCPQWIYDKLEAEK